MIKKEKDITCPLCKEQGVQVDCIPTEKYDSPFETYIDCPNCGIYDLEGLEEVV